MIFFDIAEWVANLFILGIGFFLWTLSIFIIVLIIKTLTNKILDEV